MTPSLWKLNLKHGYLNIPISKFYGILEMTPFFNPNLGNQH